MMDRHVLRTVIVGDFSRQFLQGGEFLRRIFWKNAAVSAVVDNLKLRASYGVLGNQNIGVYPYQQIYELGHDYPFGNPATLQSGAYIENL